ncbi:torsin-4A-like isoform X2 [Narcine bancroftii]|uniref:torsin-4A-like isoform X2 n=1 Tax=Narcine bancroftii TaxID=1343680 RepID=UPI00383222D6
MEDIRHLPSHRKRREMEGQKKYRLVRVTTKLRLVRSRRQPRSRTGADTASLHRPAEKKKCGSKRRVGHKPQRLAGAWPGTDALATCLLYVLGGVVAAQVYSGSEDPEEIVAAYELGHLERMLYGELVGQALAVQRLTRLLRGYLSTSRPTEPLLLSVHGPRGVGKSFLGMLLSKHFKSTLEPEVVYLHSALHHPEGDVSSQAPVVLSRARKTSHVPFLLFDHMEHAAPKLLDSVSQLLASSHPDGAIFILLSSIGGDLVARRPVGSREALARLAKGRHPLWASARFITLLPLDLPHVGQCTRRAMERAGFYPDDPRANHVAGALTYYRAGRRFFSQLGCKPVPAMIRKLKAQEDLLAKAVAGKSGQLLPTEGRGISQNIRDNKIGEQEAHHPIESAPPS